MQQTTENSTVKTNSRVVFNMHFADDVGRLGGTRPNSRRKRQDSDNRHVYMHVTWKYAREEHVHGEQRLERELSQ